MKTLIQYEDQIGEEYVTYARIESADQVDLMAKRLLEDIAADEKVHAEDLKLAVDIESSLISKEEQTKHLPSKSDL